MFLVLLLFRQPESGFVSLTGTLPSRPVTIIALVAGVIACVRPQWSQGSAASVADGKHKVRSPITTDVLRVGHEEQAFCCASPP